MIYRYRTFQKTFAKNKSSREGCTEKCKGVKITLKCETMALKMTTKKSVISIFTWSHFLQFFLCFIVHPPMLDFVAFLGRTTDFDICGLDSIKILFLWKITKIESSVSELGMPSKKHIDYCSLHPQSYAEVLIGFWPQICPSKIEI